MKISTIIFLVIALIASIWSLVILLFYEHMPFLYARKGYKTWKLCYGDDVVFAMESIFQKNGDIHSLKEYHFANGKYKAIVFHVNGVYDGCSIFDINDHIVFSSFWKNHSRMMYEKLKDIPMKEKIYLTK